MFHSDPTLNLFNFKVKKKKVWLFSAGKFQFFRNKTKEPCSIVLAVKDPGITRAVTGVQSSSVHMDTATRRWASGLVPPGVSSQTRTLQSSMQCSGLPGLPEAILRTFAGLEHLLEPQSSQYLKTKRRHKQKMEIVGAVLRTKVLNHLLDRSETANPVPSLEPIQWAVWLRLRGWGWLLGTGFFCCYTATDLSKIQRDAFSIAISTENWERKKWKREHRRCNTGVWTWFKRLIASWRLQPPAGMSRLGPKLSL